MSSFEVERRRNLHGAIATANMKFVCARQDIGVETFDIKT